MGDEWPAKLLEEQIQSIEEYIEWLIDQKAELEFQIEELSKVKNALLTVLGAIVERTLLVLCVGTEDRSAKF